MLSRCASSGAEKVGISQKVHVADCNKTGFSAGRRAIFDSTPCPCSAAEGLHIITWRCASFGAEMVEPCHGIR